jgi:hypothetical protein
MHQSYLIVALRLSLAVWSSHLFTFSTPQSKSLYCARTQHASDAPHAIRTGMSPLYLSISLSTPLFHLARSHKSPRKVISYSHAHAARTHNTRTGMYVGFYAPSSNSTSLTSLHSFSHGLRLFLPSTRTRIRTQTTLKYVLTLFLLLLCSASIGAIVTRLHTRLQAIAYTRTHTRCFSSFPFYV